MPSPRESPPWKIDDTGDGDVPWKIDDTQPKRRLLTDADLFGPSATRRTLTDADLFGAAPKPRPIDPNEVQWDEEPQLRAAPGAQPWMPPATDPYVDIPWENVPQTPPLAKAPSHWQPPATDVYLDDNGNPIAPQRRSGAAADPYAGILWEDVTPGAAVPQQGQGAPWRDFPNDTGTQRSAPIAGAPVFNLDEFLAKQQQAAKAAGRTPGAVFNLDEALAKRGQGAPWDLDALKRARREAIVARAVAGAQARSAPTEQDRALAVFRGVQARQGSFGPAPTQEDVKAGREAGVPEMVLTAATLPLAGGALFKGVQALRGLSAARKVANIARATGTLAKEGSKFYLFDKGLEAVGVPTEGRAAILTGAGFSRPGQAARDALKRIFGGGEAAAARGARTIAQEVGAARRAAETARALGSDKAASLAAARAAREAAATQAVARARALRAGAGDPEQLVMKIQQAMSMPGGKQAVREWLATQPPEVAAQISGLLARGISRPAMVYAP